jgi:hypothetical protein
MGIHSAAFGSCIQQKIIGLASLARRKALDRKHRADGNKKRASRPTFIFPYRTYYPREGELSKSDFRPMLSSAVCRGPNAALTVAV